MADTPTSVTQNQVGFAPEIAPYAQRLLGRAESLFDEPYMQYQPERVAQYSPLQQMSYDNAALMQTSPQLQDATALAGEAGLGAINTSYTYNPYVNQQFTGANVDQYMSPYMNDVVARQQSDAQRQSDIARQAQGAQAARAGAFGGSGNMLANNQLNAQLARQKGDIQAQGLQSAFQNAQQQFNQSQAQNLGAAQLNAQQGQFGAGLGLQGLQTALTSANALGALGGQQYQQNMGVNALQNQYGLQQQAQEQTDLNNKYQDYLNAQNYPYKQIGFMSDILRGAPLTQTGSSVYQAPPSTAQTVASLGLGAAGVSKLWGGANGGVAMSNGGGLGALALNNLV
jgi:hypothetical protein